MKGLIKVQKIKSKVLTSIGEHPTAFMGTILGIGCGIIGVEVAIFKLFDVL